MRSWQLSKVIENGLKVPPSVAKLEKDLARLFEERRKLLAEEVKLESDRNGGTPGTKRKRVDDDEKEGKSLENKRVRKVLGGRSTDSNR